MLSPKRTKFRKAHKGRIHGLAKGGAQLNFGQAYLMSTLPVLFGNLGAVMGLSDRLSDVAGKVERIAELQEVLDEVEKRQAADRVAEQAPSRT